MSDTGESDMSQSGTGSSCSWAVVDQLGNLQDDDSVSTDSSVEVMNEEVDEDSPVDTDDATPVGGNSPQGHLVPSPKFVLRLPCREQEVSDTDEETSAVTNDTSSLEILSPSTQGTTLSAGSAVTHVDQHGHEPVSSISGENDSVLQSMLSRRSPPQTISSEHIESLVRAIDDVQHSLSQSHGETSPSKAQSLGVSCLNSEQSFSGPNSFSSMELFGSSTKEEASVDISKTMPENLSVRQTSESSIFENIGIQSCSKDKSDSTQSSLSSTFSLLSGSEGNQLLENVSEHKQKENDGIVKDRENEGGTEVQKSDGENEPETQTSEVVTPDVTALGQESAPSAPPRNFFTTAWFYLSTNKHKRLRNMAFVTYLILFLCFILLIGFHIGHLYQFNHYRRIFSTCDETKADYTRLELKQCRVSLNDANRANQDLEVQIGKLRYSNPDPQEDEPELEENEETEENQINRDKLDRARWEIYGKRQSEWNLLKLKEEAVQDLYIAETEFDSLRDAKEGLEAELVKMAEDITDVKKVLKKLEKTKIALLLQKTTAEQELNDKQENQWSVNKNNKENVHNEEEKVQNGDNEKMKLNENTRQANGEEEESKPTGDYSDDKKRAASNYKACWNMMEDIYRKQFSQLFDFSWVDVKSDLLDEYMKTYLPEDMLEFFIKMNQKKQNADKYSQQGTKQTLDDTQDKTSTDFRKDAGKKQSQNQKDNQSGKSEKPGSKNEEKQSKQAEPLPSWADSMLDMMNKTKSQIHDTLEQVRNVSANLWNKHEPILKKLEATFTKKLRRLNDKFQAKIAKKARKWFNKNSKQDKNQNENTVEKKTTPNAGTKRQVFSENGDSDQNKNTKRPVEHVDDPARPEIKEMTSCSHKLLVLDRVIAQMRSSGIRKELHNMGTTVVAQMLSNLRELKDSGLVNGDVYQMTWVKCQSDWWSMYDNRGYVVAEECTPYLRCWQIKKTKGKMCGQLGIKRSYVIDRYCDFDETIVEVKFEQDIDGEYFVDRPREFYPGLTDHKNAEKEKSEKFDYKPNSDGADNSVDDEDGEDDDIEDDDDNVDVNHNWYLERSEDREYHHQEPDDWFFRRAKKDIKVSSVEMLKKDEEMFDYEEDRDRSCIDF